MWNQLLDTILVSVDVLLALQIMNYFGSATTNALVGL